MDKIKENILSILKENILKIYDSNFENLSLENPPKKEYGDFSFPCFLLSKELKQNPNLIATKLKEELEKNSLFKDLNVVGPYLNLTVNFKFYTEFFLKTKILLPNIGVGKKVIVDYIGTNVGKPMHIGHMCTPNQGQITYNLYKALGYDVIGDSHIGDWGIIFGKLILAYKIWGNENKLKENAVDHLFELYVRITLEAEKDKLFEEKIRQEFKSLSKGDKIAVKYWTNFTKYSIDSMQKSLDRLNVKADFNIGESFYEGIGLPKMGDYPDLKYSMSDIVLELIEKGIATKNDDNSVGIIFEEKTKLPSVILQKRDGTHGYLASDLTTIKYRMENWNPAKMIYHVDVRQQLHLKQVFEIAKKASWIGKTKLFHAYNGFISLKTGAMSTRKGNIIKLDLLLDEAEKKAKKIIIDKNVNLEENEIEEISKIIGIGAIKYSYLSKSRTSDVIFDWDEAMTFEGNSFPYNAYNYVRGLKIIKNSSYKFEEIDNLSTNENFYKNQQINLFKEISKLNDVLIQASETFLYHNIINYVFSLSKAFSSFYSEVNVLSEKNEDKKILNLKLIKRYIEIFEIIFDILAIKLPNKM